MRLGLEAQLSAGVLLAAILGCQGGDLKLDAGTNHLITAQEALDAGDTAKAMEELNLSIEAKPSPWAYSNRAKLHSDAGNETAALTDCQEGLNLDPEHADLKWLQGELKKPAAQRFQGKNAQPPSALK